MAIVYNICFLSLSSLNGVQIPYGIVLYSPGHIKFNLSLLRSWLSFFNDGGSSGTQLISDLGSKTAKEDVSYLE